MCLAAVAWQMHPNYPLIVWLNRDEFHNRPTEPMRWREAKTEAVDTIAKPEPNQILTGKDLKAGGTWCGISQQGKLAFVTNIRSNADAKANAPSRGSLPLRFLNDENINNNTFISQLNSEKEQYSGFNLMLFDGENLGYVSSLAQPSVDQPCLTPGVYGLSNAVLNSPWPKSLQLQHQLHAWLDNLPQNDLNNEQLVAADYKISQAKIESAFSALHDHTQAQPQHLPITGINEAWEQFLSSVFILGEAYGTRSSYVIALNKSNHWQCIERTYKADGSTSNTQVFNF